MRTSVYWTTTWGQAIYVELPISSWGRWLFTPCHRGKKLTVQQVGSCTGPGAQVFPPPKPVFVYPQAQALGGNNFTQDSMITKWPWSLGWLDFSVGQDIIVGDGENDYCVKITQKFLQQNAWDKQIAKSRRFPHHPCRALGWIPLRSWESLATRGQSVPWTLPTKIPQPFVRKKPKAALFITCSSADRYWLSSPSDKGHRRGVRAVTRPRVTTAQNVWEEASLWFTPFIPGIVKLQGVSESQDLESRTFLGVLYTLPPAWGG